MRTRRLAAVFAAAVLLAGCGGNEPEEPDDVAAEGSTADTVDEPAEGSDATGTDDGAETATPEDEGADASGDDSGDTASASSQDVPEDVPLDVEMRHPSGSVLRVGGFRFEDAVIYVDFELLNGSQQFQQSFNFYQDDQLRVIDDVGNHYNVVPPEDDEIVVEVEQGEAIEASFAFYGPVVAEATELTFLMNVAPDEAETWSLEDGDTRTYNPGFVVDGIEVRR